MSFLLHRGFGTKALQTVRNLANRLRASFLRSNLYKKPSSAEETLPKELLATRIYVCLLVVFMTIITIAAASMPRTVNRVVYSPSYTHFSELTYKYPNTLYCSCTKIGITYETFVNVHVRFHQVCSSPFIQQAWIDNVFAEQNLSALPLYDFRTTLSSFWQVIADLCDISNQTWTDTMLSFGASQIFNPIAMAEKNTRVETEAAIDYHVNVVRTKLNRDLLALRRTTTGNQFVSALATNFYLHYPPDFLYPWSSLKMSPRTFDNCSCLNFQGCPHPATFIDNQGNLVRVRGMIADCLVIDGTLRSTLECYYNQTCFSRLHPSSSSSMAIEPLSNGLNKYFTINSTIEMMLNNYMLIDEMTIEIRFDSYYSQCNPTYCAYSYTHRFDVLFIITIIIGIFGGLSFVLKLLASVIATIVLRWKNKAIGNNNVVQIQTNSTYQNKCKYEMFH